MNSDERSAQIIVVQNPRGQPLAAELGGVQILVELQEGVDAGGVELADNGPHHLEIGGVHRTPTRLHARPHDAQADDVHAPCLQELDVRVREGVLRIESAHARVPGRALHDHVEAMEQTLPAETILDPAGGWSHMEIRRCGPQCPFIGQIHHQDHIHPGKEPLRENQSLRIDDGGYATADVVACRG